MRVWSRCFTIFLFISLLFPKGVLAQGEVVVLEGEGVEASQSAEATVSASPTPQPVIEKKSDITETEGEVKGKLERYLESQPIGGLSWNTFLSHAIRAAIARGVPATTVVLVLLFPMVAALIAASRHLLGLRGFGIFVPAVLSVAFVATGLISGIVLFLVILAVATLGRRLMKYLKLQYLPRMALLLWLVSLGVLALLLVSPWLNLGALATLNIFPILILVLLTENFIEVQIGKSQREAIELTVETVILAVISSLVLSLETVQRLALLYPEWIVVLVAVFNVFVGKYVGLRLSEYLKFRSILK